MTHRKFVKTIFTTLTDVKSYRHNGTGHINVSDWAIENQVMSHLCSEVRRFSSFSSTIFKNINFINITTQKPLETTRTAKVNT